MYKKISSALVVAVLASLVLGSSTPVKAQYPACDNVQGGDVTFLVCNNYSIDHYWSNTKVKLTNLTDNTVDIAIDNTYVHNSQLYINSPQTFAVDNREGRELTLILTFLGKDNLDPNRALVKVESNTTYEDSFYTKPVPVPEPETKPNMDCSDLSGGDGTYNLCALYNLTHQRSGIVLELNDYTEYYASFKLYNTNQGSTSLQTDVEKTLLVDNANNDLLKVTYRGKDEQGRAVVEVKYQESVVQLNATNIYVSEVYNQNLVDISWDKVHSALNYEVRIDSEVDGYYSFDDVYTSISGQKITGFQLGTADNYRVKVRPYIDYFDNSPWSEYTYFTKNQPLPQLIAPTVYVSSVYGATYSSINLIDASWTKINGAAGYELLLERKDENTGNYVTASSSIFTPVDLDNPAYQGVELLAKAEYRLSVRALDNYFNYGPWSSYVYFVDKDAIHYDKSEPKVTVATNKTEYYDDELVVVTANATDDNRVSAIEIYSEQGWLLKTCQDVGTCVYQFTPKTDNLYSYYFSSQAYDPSANVGSAQSNLIGIKARTTTNTEPYYTQTTGQVKVKYELIGSSWLWDTNGEVKFTYSPKGIISDFGGGYSFYEGQYAFFTITPDNGELRFDVNTSNYTGGIYKLNNFNDNAPTYDINTYSTSYTGAKPGDVFVYYSVDLGFYFKVEILSVTEQFNTTLDTVSITKPLENASILYDQNLWWSGGSNNPSIEWSSVNNASTYKVELDRYYDSTTGYVNESTWSPFSYSSQIFYRDIDLGYYGITPGEYRVRVQGANELGQFSNWSEYRFFKVYKDTIAKPTISYPVNNQKIYHDSDQYFYYGHDIWERDLKTTWDWASGAEYFEVLYEKYDPNTKQWTSAHNAVTYWEASYGMYYLLKPGQYRVKARGLDNYNNTGDWSDYVNFTIYSHKGKAAQDYTGSDASYVVLKGSEINHTATNIKAKVLVYDHGVVYLELENASKTMIYVAANNPYAVQAQNGKWLQFNYESIDENNGVTLKLTTL